MTIRFFVHLKADSVGVATVDIKAGETATGLYMDTQEHVEVEANDDIPPGHCIAMVDHDVDDAVIKYGHEIGRVVTPKMKGGHVDIRNLKTWQW